MQIIMRKFLVMEKTRRIYPEKDIYLAKKRTYFVEKRLELVTNLVLNG